MKIAIVGSRTLSKTIHYKEIEKILDEILPKDIEIVSGGAVGVDTNAAFYARKNRIKLVVFLPDWDNNGKAAGFIRNKAIVNYCDELIAFHDGESKGTLHSIELAKKSK